MSKEYLTKALFNSIDKLTFDNIEEVEEEDNKTFIDERWSTNDHLNTIEAEICAKDDIKTNCECKNNDDIVILVDTRFEKRCIRISIRS